MQYADLNATTQVIIVGLLAFVGIAIAMRTANFLRREWAGEGTPYPSAWSSEQCRALEYFRRFVGIALLALWGTFLYIAPLMPTNFPFGYLETVSLLALLLLSYCWIAFLTPLNARRLRAYSPSFKLTFVFLTIWWVSMLMATGWMLSKTTASAHYRALPVGHFAGKAARTNITCKCSLKSLAYWKLLT